MSSEQMKELKGFISIDLYNVALNTPDNTVKRYCLGLLKERSEHDLIYSVAINT